MSKKISFLAFFISFLFIILFFFLLDSDQKRKDFLQKQKEINTIYLKINDAK